MRDKEVKQDYRFIPEPNLPPLHVFRSAKSAPSNNSPKVIIEDLQQQLPTLPYKLRELLMSEYDCTLFQAGFLVVIALQNTVYLGSLSILLCMMYDEFSKKKQP